MSLNPRYTQFHPRWYRVRKPIFWWVDKRESIKFILRELTSVFVAIYAVILLFEIRSITQGPEAYLNFLAWLRTPFSLILHTVAFLFVLYHSITWFNLAPKALSLSLGKRHVPAFVIAALHYAGWIFVSIAIAWILLRD
ncbi:fumarate reductase subunit C [bacterium]|nr:fumarate reductase subunit C [bacterium]